MIFGGKNVKKTDEKEVRIKLRSIIYEVDASLFSDDDEDGLL